MSAETGYRAGEQLLSGTPLDERQMQGSDNVILLDLDYSEALDVALDVEHMPQKNHRKWHQIRDPLNVPAPSNWTYEMGGGDADSASWFGLRDFAQLRDLFENGWQEGLIKIHELAAEIERELPPPVDVRRRPVWTSEGDELDRDRLMAGQIDQMWRVAKRARGRVPRVVRLVTEIGGSAYMTPMQMYWAGASMVATAKLLEGAGYRTELIAAHSISGYEDVRGNVSVTSYRLKEAREPLREDVVAFGASHSGFFRAIALMTMGHLPWRTPPAHGSVNGLRQAYTQLVKKGLAPAADAFFSAQRDATTAADSVRNALVDITGDKDLFTKRDTRGAA